MTRLELRRRLKARSEQIFSAWTTPETIERFFCPPDVKATKVTVDLRVGGRYSITMLMSDGERWTVGGVYREIVPPQRIVCTWEWKEDDPALAKETLLTLEFFERGDETELVLTHEAFRDEAQRDRHERGWSTILRELDAEIATTAHNSKAFTVSGIDLSGYMVKDAARAIGFYRDVLGIEPARIYPENRGAEYELADGSTFGLWGGGGKVMPFQPSNGILFAVDDFDRALSSVKARGITMAMQNETSNCRMAAFNDTEGNLVFLHQRKAAF
jgi:uncharacterized protein YndB with AHSA1/START domain/predicted enzyme related to lactoylglutathione lyase